jgi:hypothetical protein
MRWCISQVKSKERGVKAVVMRVVIVAKIRITRIDKRRKMKIKIKIRIKMKMKIEIKI